MLKVQLFFCCHEIMHSALMVIVCRGKNLTTMHAAFCSVSMNVVGLFIVTRRDLTADINDYR